MEQRKEIVRQYSSRGVRLSNALLISGIPKSTYYHKPNGRPKGKRPSCKTIFRDQLIPNEEVVCKINEILMDDFIDYGYQNIHQVLRKQGYKINHKKVYRLMKENRLLHPERHISRRKRTFVKFTTPQLIHPFATIEIDIKFVYLWGVNRHAYLATAFDTFTRMAIDWEIGYQMTNDSIAKLISRCVTNELVKPYIKNSKLRVRSDNGPQFISLRLGKALEIFPSTRNSYAQRPQNKMDTLNPFTTP